MAYKISTLEIRQQLGDILNRVSIRHDEFIVERKGKPLAALVPVEKIQQMRAAARLHLLSVLDINKGPTLSEEESMMLANQAKHKSRKPRSKTAKHLK